MKGTIIMNSQQNSTNTPSRLVFSRVTEEWDPVPTGRQVFLNTNESTEDHLPFNNTRDDYDR